MDASNRSDVLAVVYAIHDFHAENPDELSFSAGQAIQVTEKDDLYGDGWWQGRNTKGQLGLFPQAYTLPAPPTPSAHPLHSAPPAQPASPSTPQPTMHETLFQVQNAIDQLHHPSPSTHSLPRSSAGQPSPLDRASHPNGRTGSASEDGEDADDRDPTLNLQSDPARTRALLAQKAQADSDHSRSLVMARLVSASSQLHLSHRTSLTSLISVPGIGEIELSEESGAEEEPAHDHPSPLPIDQHVPRSHRATTGPPAEDRRRSKDPSLKSPSPNHPSTSVSTGPPASDASRQATFKTGPFSAAAIALGLTGSSHEKASPKPLGGGGGGGGGLGLGPIGVQKGHRAKKPSSSSLLSDMGLDLREHFNLNSAPVASTLRMSRESTQFSHSSPLLSKLDRVTTNSIPDGFRPTVPNGPSLEPPDRPRSPQEHLAQGPIVPSKTPFSSRSQENLGLARRPASSHERQASASSARSGLPLGKQPSPSLNPTPPIIPEAKTSVSTTDSSSNKGSRSRSSSRVEQFISVEDQPTSPATSMFPSSAGARPGGGSISSSHSRSHKQVGFGSFASLSPEGWSVADVVDWARIKGLDEFTIAKFTEHDITGDVLLELDVNALKEIELTAFGRRVRVMKAIEELKKNTSLQKQTLSGSMSPLSNGPQATSSNDSSQPLVSHSLSPRQELLGGGARLDSAASKQDHNPLRYPRGYHPNELSDPEEELVHQPSRQSPSCASHARSHTSRPSDTSGFSFHRRHERLSSHSSREDLNGPIQVSAYKRTSSSSGRPHQATFSNVESVPAHQSRHNHSRSKSIGENIRRSRASSCASVTDAQPNPLSDSIKPVDELEEPSELAAEDQVDSKAKKGKKRRAGNDKKPPGTATSLKTKRASPDSPDFRSPSIPNSPDKAHDQHPIAKSRTSFLGNLRGRKPPPKLSSPTPLTSGVLNGHTDGDLRPTSSSAMPPSSINGKPGRSIFHFGHDKVQGQAQHQIQHLTPLAESKNLISLPLPVDDKEVENPMVGKKEGETRTALERIGEADHQGWMRKKGEKYPTWKSRYFILKGSNLYYLKSQNEIRIKGVIKLNGFKVVMDADVHPGRYGFRIIHDNGSFHLFSADDSKLVRDWMKAMMKATIDRDWIAPVISSCNIRTISIRDAQKMFPPPRPPSPSSRAKLQKARLAANNPAVLTEKDASILMGIQSLQPTNAAHRRTASTSPTNPSSQTLPANVTSLRPRKSIHRPSQETSMTSISSAPDDSHPNWSASTTTFKSTPADQEVLRWINQQLSQKYGFGIVEATDFSNSIKNGRVLVRLIECLTNSSSGLKDDQFLKVDDSDGHLQGAPGHPSLHHRQTNSIIECDDDFDIYFSIFDYLNTQRIPLDGYSLNDLISGDPFKTRDFLTRVYQQFRSS